MIHKEKVLAYIIREIKSKTELLVFDHVDIPKVGTQVPAGTLELGESPENGVIREIYEESGLENFEEIRFLGNFEYISKEKQEIHNRHVFCLKSIETRDEWVHIVSGNGEDNMMKFKFFWVELDEAEKILVGGQGNYLKYIQKLTQEQIEKLGLKSKKLIGSGMEATVFDNNDDTVVKIYPNNVELSNFHKLKLFYDSLDTKNLNFELPKIYNVEEKSDCILVTEKKLNGKVFTLSNIKNLSSDDAEKFLNSYVNALFSIKEINSTIPHQGEFLYRNPKIFPERKNNDWNDFIVESLKYKYGKLNNVFNENVVDFQKKFEKLVSAFSTQYTGKYDLIHGDFYPGNIMFSDNLEVSSVFDFGTFTMKGDHLFDVALGWQFMDMYNKSNIDWKNQIWQLINIRITEDEKVKIFRYILVYSILAIDQFSDDISDGQFQWCLKNLNNKDFWERANV